MQALQPPARRDSLRANFLIARVTRVARVTRAARVALVALVVAQWPGAAGAAPIYRWIDKQGKTHFGDAVPSEYKDMARLFDNKVIPASSDAPARATERIAEQASKTTPTTTPTAPTAAPAPFPTAPKRPPRAPAEDTDCATWRRLYLQSQDCFGPYRTARGATPAQAFEHCTSVNEPPPRCGRNAP